MENSHYKPKTKTGAGQDSSYFACARHPAVKKAKPGKCPECGKNLRLKK